MKIDFHTHIFPDALAEKAMGILCDNSRGFYRPIHDGTLKGLLRCMDAAGIDASVLAPVLTKHSQTKGLNEWAANMASPRIIGFGGIYPHTDGYRDDIDFVAGLGLKGLKFHAEYQEFYLDDPHMLRVYDYALSKGLIILHHGGFDPAYDKPYRASPERFANVAKAMKGGVIVAAHLGGQGQWDEAEEYLAGTDLYMDTSMGFEYFTGEQFMRIVKKHGADKLLFATDSPWSDVSFEMKSLYALPLTDDEKDAIAGGNAKRILKL